MIKSLSCHPDEGLMNFPGKGSTTSLNSMGSTEAVDGINFTIGIPEEQQDEINDELAALRRTGSSGCARNL